MMWDSRYLWFFLPGVLLSLWGQWRVKRTFAKYAAKRNAAGITGQETARAILDSEGLQRVPVGKFKGNLTDHYDPRKNEVWLSQHVYGQKSISAMAVGAHETGHAIQDKKHYLPMRMRGAIAPFANIGTNVGYFAMISGVVAGQSRLAWIGFGLFALTTIFALVTLPVEFDASKRAKKKLEELGLVNEKDAAAVKEMLDAAAFTYVASFMTSALVALYWLTTVNRQTGTTTAAAAPTPTRDAASRPKVVLPNAGEGTPRIGKFEKKRPGT